MLTPHAGELDVFGWTLNASTHQLENKTEIAASEFYAVGVDPAGRIYAYDEEGAKATHHVDVFAAGAGAHASPVEEFGAGTIGESTGIAYSPHGGGTVYVTDATSNQVHVYTHGSATPPEVRECSVTPSAESATVSCTIEPEAGEATWKLEYRAPAGTFNKATGGTVTAEGEVDGDITGLEPASEYDWRMSASNTSGEGASQGVFVTQAVAPAAIAEAASAMLARSATLNGKVNPENSTTAYRFEYGPCASAEEASCKTSPYPDSTPEATRSGDGAVAISEHVEELQPGGIYHYRVLAVDSVGEASSEEEVFTTTSLAHAEAITGAASAVSQTAATISGTVDPNGQPTSYAWEVGTTTGYGTSVYGSAGEGSRPQAVTLALTGLLADTTYHYRLLASNRSGTVYGADQTFTTQAYNTPQALTVPPAPLLIPMPVFPAVNTATTKGLTRAQKLAKALKACKKDHSRSKRAACEKKARKTYGTRAKKQAKQ